MIPANTLTCKNLAALRAWLRRHHDKETEIWLVFFKKDSGIAGVSYAEALDEALCFGWIDGMLRKLDEQRYCRRFTPRKTGSSWSAANVAHMRRLIDEGRMTEAGLRVFDATLLDQQQPVNPGRREREIPVWMADEFTRHPEAWKNFNALPPSQQRLYLGWILHAKKPETRRRRFAEALSKLARNERLGLK
jgi:uncharacterized protein YdeI (YjbR/CyaY-like superfamily)